MIVEIILLVLGAFAVFVINILWCNIDFKKAEKGLEAHYTDKIKPYVEFTVKVNSNPVKAARAQFEIRSTLKFKDLEIRNGIDNKNEITLRKLALDSTILIVLPFTSLPKPVKLGSKEIDVDLSKFSLAV